MWLEIILFTVWFLIRLSFFLSFFFWLFFLLACFIFLEVFGLESPAADTVMRSLLLDFLLAEEEMSAFLVTDLDCEDHIDGL